VNDLGIGSVGGFTHGDTSLDRMDTGDSIASEDNIDVENLGKLCLFTL
jgi:hypothetical protein